MEAFIYCGDIYCAKCARKRAKEDTHGPILPPSDRGADSDRNVVGPYPDGGGEADSPQHCADCGVFLHNPLTPAGVEYALVALDEHRETGRGSARVLDLWARELRDYGSEARARADLYLDYRTSRSRSKDARAERLAPGGVPRWVRCYDNGGETADRYTVVFTGRAAGKAGWPYLAMSAAPFHPQGFGQHGDAGVGACWPVDCNGKQDGRTFVWPPALGRKNHLGTRIRFQDLPEDCKRCVWSDYSELWTIPNQYLQPKGKAWNSDTTLEASTTA